MPSRPLLVVDALRKHFSVRRGAWGRARGVLRAVDGVSFELGAGESLGLVGESGCGKTTVARCVLRLTQPTSGRVLFDGDDVHALDRRSLRAIRPRMQMVFQDPYASLDPRMTVGRSIGEPLQHRGDAARRIAARVAELMGTVGLSASLASRYPHELSGGQRQRVGIARALASSPSLVVCDEPVAALDVSIQAQIVNLLRELQDRLHLAYLFISHDLGMVRHLCHNIAVMYLGKIVEVGPSERVLSDPKHPYTQALLSSLPRLGGRNGTSRRPSVLPGEMPSALEPPAGCAFHPRCSMAEPSCSRAEPELRAVGSDRHAACDLI